MFRNLGRWFGTIKSPDNIEEFKKINCIVEFNSDEKLNLLSIDSSHDQAG
ncbi:hypothetical protein PUR_22470 [Paenibacillus sp. URB8-2]|nr:hypothetical protein PUR_22470 [Paenibacillus sp. URB8-2]